MRRFLIGGGIIFTLLMFSLYFYKNNQFWTHRNTSCFEELVEYKTDYTYGLKGQQILVNKGFKSCIEQLNSYAQENNIELIVTQSYREPHQKLTGTIVAPVKNSNHISGFAIDINILHNNSIYLSADLGKFNHQHLPNEIVGFINKVRENKKLRWGGDFKTEDPVHIDYPLNLMDNIEWNKKSMQCQKEYLSSSYKWQFWL